MGDIANNLSRFLDVFSNWMGNLVQLTLCGICTDQLSETAGVEFPDHNVLVI